MKGPSMMMVFMNDGMVLATRDQPSVDGKGGRAGDQERERGLPQKRKLSSPASIAPGMFSMIALSTISMIGTETVSAAIASFSTAQKARPARPSGTIVKGEAKRQAGMEARTMVSQIGTTDRERQNKHK